MSLDHFLNLEIISYYGGFGLLIPMLKEWLKGALKKVVIRIKKAPNINIRGKRSTQRIGCSG